jgi:enamine deaminase RidA (YjgF/YER057c/UK114 family)
LALPEGGRATQKAGLEQHQKGTPMIRTALMVSLAALGLATAASAAPKFVTTPGAAPAALAASPISAGAIVPAGSEIFFVSGIPGAPTAGNTEAQTKDCLTKLEAVLKANGYSLSDVVNAKVYLVADPATGKMDFQGMNTAFKTFFGTTTEPNKPSRVTVQIAGLAAAGSLVEIELTAAK